MFKKFLATILVLSISTVCTTVFCSANCDVDKLEVNTFGINECGPYDVSLYLSRDTIKELCPESALKKRWIIKDLEHTIFDSCLKTFKPGESGKKGCKAASIFTTGLATAAPFVLSAIALSIQNKHTGKGYDPAGRRSIPSDEDFCNSLWNVFKENEDCGVIINFQRSFSEDDSRALLADMNITSQK